MFALITLAVVSLAIVGATLTPFLSAALLWIILFFSAFTSIAHSFVKEEDSHTAPLLRVFATGATVFWGKLAFNLALLLMLTIIATPLFVVFTHSDVGNIALLIVSLLLGIVGLAGGTTIVAAIVAQAETRGALFATLAAPILLPALLLVVEATSGAFAGGTFAEATTSLQGLIAYNGVMITASTMLFDHVWR